MARAEPPGAGVQQTGGGAEAQLDVLHLDMDCFFASVEVLDDPSLAGRPLVVGGTGERGVVCSASYEARAYGVHSAMPTGEARRLCPQAVYLPPRHARYGELSEAIHALLLDVTPTIEPLGLDEAFLDVSGAHRLHGPSVAIAVALRRRVAGELGLACSVGVARSKLLAKLASKAAKPRVGRSLPGAPPPQAAPGGPPGQPSADGIAALWLDDACVCRLAGVVAVPARAELGFLHGHPVRALPGVGPRTADRLGRFGVATVGDLATVPLDSLQRALGNAHGSALHALASGRDDRRVLAERATRSIGHEETFARDLRDGEELVRRARAMASAVSARCRQAGVTARTITVKLRFADFSTRTRSRTLAAATADLGTFVETALALLAEAPPSGGVRLLGVHASGLADGEPAHQQLGLFDSGEPARAVTEELIESVRARFGERAITSAAALSGRPGVRDDGGGALGAEAAR